jgi:transposase
MLGGEKQYQVADISPLFYANRFLKAGPPQSIPIYVSRACKRQLSPTGKARDTSLSPAFARPADPLGPLRPTGRFSAQRKGQAVVRLLRGEDLETLSRQFGVTAATLSMWREEFLAAGTAALKSHPDEDDPRDDLIQRLKAKIGELTMENELLYEKARRLDEQLPLAQRRSRR